MMGYGYGNMMGGYGYNMMGGGVFGFISIVVMVLAAFAVYKIITNDSSIKNNDALQMLNNRFASGEINDEQYKAMRNTLTMK